MFKSLFFSKKQPKSENVSSADSIEIDEVSIEEPEVTGEPEPHPFLGEAKESAEEEKQSWLGRLRHGLRKSSSRLGTGIAEIFTKQRLDDETLEALEDLLISADLGVKTARSICESLRRKRVDKEVSQDEIKQLLVDELVSILGPIAKPLTIGEHQGPYVMVMVGVNGNGKTTTVGKLAKQYTEQGKKVMIAACDTFRAAATDQISVWAKRVGVDIIVGQAEADPASVAYTALERAKEAKTDILLIDTAGRLHVKKNLMEELGKIIRVIQKIAPDAPHQTLLVLDATTGQNAFKQVEAFQSLVPLSGLIVTKLDGTAKGGVVVGLAKEYSYPIVAIGVGEGIYDLSSFEAVAFAKNLVGIEGE